MRGVDMKKTGLAWMAGMALLLAVAGAAAQGVKIAFVNAARIEAESVQAKRALEELKKEFEPREKQILELQRQIKVDQDRFEKEKATMPAAELKALGNSIATRMRDSDQMVFGMQADFEQRKKERGAKLIEEAAAAVAAVAKQGNIDLVLHDVPFASPTIDITDQVLKEMARRAGN